MQFLARLAAVLGILTFTAWADEKARFDKYMENTRALVEKQHLIATVTYQPSGTNKEATYRYDHYPEIERLQMHGGMFVRKKGKPWVESDDWGATGKRVKPDKEKELSLYADIPMVPLGPVTPPRDPTQGAQVYDLEKTEPIEDAERLFIRITREHPTGFVYPQFVFHRYKDENNALLEGFAGNLNLPDGKAHVNITYGFLISVKADVQVAKPDGSTKAVSPKAPKKK